MAPPNETLPPNGETGNKGGWFDRFKSKIGFGKETPAAEAESLAEAAAAETLVSPEPALPAASPEVPVPSAEPAIQATPPEPALFATPAEPAPVAEPAVDEPALAPDVPEQQAAAAPVVPETAPPVAAADTPTAAPEMATGETGITAEAATEAPGGWLARFKGRFGMALGKPAVEEAVVPPVDAPVAAVPEATLPPSEAVAEPVAADLVSTETAEVTAEKKSWFQRLTDRLSETRQGLVSRVHRLTHGRTKIDDDLLDELEEVLLTSDVGPKTTDAVLDFLRQKAKDSRFLPDEVVPALREYLMGRLSDGAAPIAAEHGQMTIFLMVGVNGVGKTTTTGKIAAKFRLNDYKVLLAAADTFRAAAIDQLQVWSQRAGVDLIRHAEGGDAAAVVYDAIKAAKARGTDVLIVDTAGRLHTKHNLMEELRKVHRIIEREAPQAKVESLLVLDATTGQNGLRQAEVFSQATPLTGVIVTKLDGTAKGGVVFSIKESLGLPIRLLGVGEGLEDLREFDPALFVDALFASDETAA